MHLLLVFGLPTGRLRAVQQSDHNNRRPDDQKPGRLPYMTSLRGNLIWSCRVYGQPPGVRLVLRASADGNVWASVGTVETEEPPARRVRKNARRDAADE